MNATSCIVLPGLAAAITKLPPETLLAHCGPASRGCVPMGGAPVTAEQIKYLELPKPDSREITTAHDGHTLEAEPVLRRASDVTPREIEHLWPDVLYIGKPTLFVGDPGLGKSIATNDIAARTSRGTPWPLGASNPGPGDVLLCSAEDDPEDTIVPRLIAAGADLERITFWEAVAEIDPESGLQLSRAVSLDRHLEQLSSIARRKSGRLRLVVIDPIAAFLGDADSHKNSDIRTLVAGLARIASEHRFAVLIVSHLNKSASTKAVYRVMGSLAFVAAARACFAVMRDPGDPERRLLLPVKNNLAVDTAGFSFCINVSDNGIPYVSWGDEAVSQETSDNVLEGESLNPREQGVTSRVREVTDWLKSELKDGARAAAEMWPLSEEEGFSRRDVDRAKKFLGVRGAVQGFRGGWYWSLPGGKP